LAPALVPDRPGGDPLQGTGDEQPGADVPAREAAADPGGGPVRAGRTAHERRGIPLSFSGLLTRWMAPTRPSTRCRLIVVTGTPAEHTTMPGPPLSCTRWTL